LKDKPMITVQNAVLVTLTIQGWSLTRRDAQASQEAAEANDVSDRKLCRVRKNLFARNPQVRQISRVEREARDFLYANTHAWLANGTRVLMKGNYEAFMARMEELRKEYLDAVKQMAQALPALKEQARGVLGKLYKEADYPADSAALAGRYDFRVRVQPLPMSQTLLELGFESEDLAQLQSELEDQMQEAFVKANERVWGSMRERLDKLRERLADAEATIRQSSLEAVCETARLLPRVSVTEDPRLEVVSARVLGLLEKLKSTTLNSNPAARARVFAAVDQLVVQMDEMMKTMHRSKAVAYLRAA
jgi:hypothetical protein